MAHYYITKKSTQTGRNQSVEIEATGFPSELLKLPPDQDDPLSTKMCGYAMERVQLRFHDEILAGRVVYTVISDDWRMTSWLKAA
ncbi:MAG: hypothetical protein K2R98_10845 [Gemmataceae bacterium]|nr:hypothetical protein [Gemmataceae bacterium]